MIRATDALAGLERQVERALSAGLVLSALFWLAGLLLHQTGLLWLGMITLLMTPLLRLLVVGVGFLLAREWGFAAVSLWILALVGSSVYLAARAHPASAPPAASSPAPR